MGPAKIAALKLVALHLKKAYLFIQLNRWAPYIYPLKNYVVSHMKMHKGDPMLGSN